LAHNFNTFRLIFSADFEEDICTLRDFKYYCANRYLVARNYASIAITQLVDTVLFSFLGLYGIIHNITSIIIVSYAIKLLAVVIATPFVAISHKVHKEITMLS